MRLARTALAGLLAVGSLAVGAPALAGGASANVTVTIGSPQVYGVAGDTIAEVSLRLKRNGTVIANKTITTESSGFFEVTLKPIHVGDKLVIVYLGTRTVTIPRLTLTANAATDTVSGHLPVAGTASVQHGDVVGTFSKGGTTVPFMTNPSGDFSGTLPGLTGADYLELSWRSPADDSFVVRRALPAAQVQVGKPTAWLFGTRGTTVKAELLSPAGAVRGTATVTIPATVISTQATFRKNGSKVAVKAGDRVRMGGVVGLTVRTPDLVALSQSADATCFADQDWIAGSLFNGGAFNYLDNGTADPTGAVDASWGSSLSSGTKVELLCENAKGFVQELVDQVP